MSSSINSATDKKIDLVSDSSVKPVKDKQGRVYATGRRKSASARVWIKPGKGLFLINKRSSDKYFPNISNVHLALEPLRITNNQDKFDVICTVKGSGTSGQAGAIKHGIARALDKFDADANHSTLRKSGCLTRDARQVERKKYGLSGARKSYQFSKR